MIKTLVIVGSILICLMPWASGGRDHIWILVTAFPLAIGAFLILRRSGRHTVSTRALSLSLGAWVGWAALGLLWSVNRFQTETWILLALMAVATGFLTANLHKKEKTMLITGYIWVAAITAAIGIFIFLTGEYSRLTSTFYWANPAAGFLLPAILIGASRWLRGRRPADLAMLAVTLTGFWLADSRGAYLVLVVIGLALALAVPKIRQYWKRLLLLVLITYAAAFGFTLLKNNFVQTGGLAPGSRFSEAALGESQSGSDRINFLKAAGSIWWDNPVAGTGAGTFGTVHPQYQQSVVSAANDPHNFYVQTLAEQGFIGAIVLAWVILLLLIGLARGYTRDNNTGIISISAIALLLHFGIDIGARYPAILILFAVLVGIGYQPWKNRKITPRDNLLPAAVIVTIVLMSVANYQSSMWRERGLIFDDNRELDRAAESYQNARKLPVYDPDNWNSEGIDYYAQAIADKSASSQKLAEAKNRAEAAIKHDPNDSQHYFLLGRTEYLAKNYPAAESAYGNAIKLDRFNHPEYYQDLASLQITMENRQAAQTTVDQGLELYTDEVIANRNADRDIKPAVSQLLTFRAAEQILQGDKDGAKTNLERAIKLNPLNFNAHGLLIRIK